MYTNKVPNNIYCIIYIVKNTINKKCYIGQTWQNLDRRFYEHKKQKKCPKLFNAINKYGGK